MRHYCGLKIFGRDNGQNTGQLGLANHGTLFLHEVDCLPLSLQSLVVHLFESRTFQPFESQVECLVNVRIIAATTQDLQALVVHGHFSRDLYERLSVLKIHVPPLRERRADLRELFPYLTKRLCAELSLPVPAWIDEHHFELWDYDWPGNVKRVEESD
ncbi:sigma 54-interacting transcriptional regulator [Vibrio sp. PP-XX7]